MTRLSYSSLNNLHNGHEWINKQMGIPVPDYPFLTAGKKAHRIIQDHVSGKKKDKRLKHIEINFPVVEEVDFDERCKFSHTLFIPEHNEKYEIMGYIDGLDEKGKKFLEIKTSSTPWSIKKFRDSMQRKMYAYGKPFYKEAYLITGSKDPDEWEKSPPKLYSVKLTGKDQTDAHEWIMKGVEKLRSGDFSGGLDENGKCMGCFWNMNGYRDIANCNFL